MKPYKSWTSANSANSERISTSTVSKKFQDSFYRERSLLHMEYKFGRCFFGPTHLLIWLFLAVKERSLEHLQYSASRSGLWCQSNLLDIKNNQLSWPFILETILLLLCSCSNMHKEDCPNLDQTLIKKKKRRETTMGQLI